MTKINKLKIASIILAILSLICFFVLIVLRKYDPTYNILKLITLSLSLVITSIILIMRLIKDIKAHKKFIHMLSPIVDLMVCVLILPLLF